MRHAEYIVLDFFLLISWSKIYRTLYGSDSGSNRRSFGGFTRTYVAVIAQARVIADSVTSSCHQQQCHVEDTQCTLRL